MPTPDVRPGPPSRRWWSLSACALGALAIGGLLLTSWSSGADKPSGDLISSLVEAQQALETHDIEGAQRILEHAEGLAGEAEDRAEVQRRLALVDWKYHGRFDPARERLLKAVRGAGASETWAALARLEQARDEYSAAAEAARQALVTAELDRDRHTAGLALARAAVGTGIAARRAGEPVASPALIAAAEAMRELVLAEPGLLEPSVLSLRASLLLDQGEAALAAWRSYFHVTEGLPTANAVAEAGDDLGRILPSWTGDERTAAQWVELVSALARSRFFLEAALAARDPRAGDTVLGEPGVAAILAYADAIERIRGLSEDYYRRTLLGQGNRSVFQKSVEAELTAVVRAIEGEKSRAAGSMSAVRSYLAERFGSYVSLGTTATYYDLHMGHRVVDETRTVEQYGRRAELRFVALDTMVSNGFQSWAWEEGQHGGWAGPDVIYQVRPAYVGGPIEIWRRLNDPADLKELETMIARESARDDERAQKDPHAFLPGLQLRLRKQGIFGVLERLKAEGLGGSELRTRFLAEVESAKQESSIYAHEGRHAIEKRAGTKGSTEYEAKLSEVAFAPEPRLALGAILSSNIGAPTPHGKANLRIVQGVVAWMAKHRAEIDGLDPERPVLPQFDRLTDEQIREAFRSLDPLYEGRASSRLD